MKTTPPRAPRKLRPRPAITAAPIAVSDLTSYDLAGLPKWQFRDLARRHPSAGWSRVGHRLIIRADRLLALLDQLGEPAHGEALSVAETTDEPATAADVLAMLGRRSA